MTISAHLDRPSPARIAASALLVAGALLAALLFAAPARAEFGFLAAWGEQGSGDGQFEAPAGVAADGQGNVYVADSFNNRVQVFGPCHEFVASLGGSGSGAGQLNTPLGVALGPGDVYVADTNNSRIEEFSADGAFLSKWGSLGSGDGQFQFAVGVGTDPLGDVYVTESYPNDRVQMFGDPPPTIADLIAGVEELHLHHGIANSLVAKLKNIDEGDPAGSTAGRLGAFVAELNAQSGKKVPADAAARLIADAARVLPAGPGAACSRP